MSKYRAIIVEDEKLTRLSLMQKLEKDHPDIEIVDCCFDAESACESIYRNRPDLLFLDIQLPGEDSFWLIEQLEKVITVPPILFTTTHSEPELLHKAIKVSAVDYLFKPVSTLDLAAALKKFRLQNRPKQVGTEYLFRTATGSLRAREEDIVYIRADANYSLLTLPHNEEPIFESLGNIEKRLNPEVFIRVGRSLILNKNYIYKVDRKNQTCTLQLPSGKSYRIKIPEKYTGELL